MEASNGAAAEATSATKGEIQQILQNIMKFKGKSTSSLILDVSKYYINPCAKFSASISVKKCDFYLSSN